MKMLAAFYFLCIVLLLSSCAKKNDTTTNPTFELAGIGDVDIYQDDTVTIPLTLTGISGPREPVSLSISKLPNKVGNLFDVLSDTPDFISNLRLIINHNAVPGTYDVVLKATPATGTAKEYPFKLRIDPIPDCRVLINGSFLQVPNKDFCERYVDTSATIELSSTDDEIIISGLGYKPLHGKVDCENRTIVLDSFKKSFYTVSSTASFKKDTVNVLLHFQPPANTPLFPFDCLSTLVRK